MASATASPTSGFLQLFATGAARFSRACPLQLKRGRALLLSAAAAAALAFVFGGASVARATVTFNWVGGTSTSWNTAANWNPASTPTLVSNIVIDTRSSNQPVISGFNALSGSVVVGSSAISNGSTLLSILSGGTLTGTVNGTIGDGTSSTGAVLISGATSQWALGVLTVGNNGAGTLTVTNGGTLDAFNADGSGNAITLGNQTGSSGNISVNHGSLTLDAGGLLVGSNGNGSVTIANGSNLTISAANSAGNGLSVGLNAGTSSVTIQDAGSFANIAGAVLVGNMGNGTLNIANGANVTIGGRNFANMSLIIGGYTGSSSNVTVDGANSSLDIAGGGAIAVGYSGNGNLTISEWWFGYRSGQRQRNCGHRR